MVGATCDVRNFYAAVLTFYAGNVIAGADPDRDAIVQ